MQAVVGSFPFWVWVSYYYYYYYYPKGWTHIEVHFFYYYDYYNEYNKEIRMVIY